MSLFAGITGSGKTNTVKKILESVNEPFLVIEPVKKEYRNIKKDIEIYTMGRPEINCIKMNPFYVPMGISLQQHIDSLKDLFSASFSFYGPMPYIFEKCLYNIYEKKGWNLTFGLHSYYLEENKNSLSEELFDNSKLEEFYKTISHKYLFPNMQDLKEEVANYINKMSYEGEIKGNIEGAIKARIDSLCVGAKGYMFNTNDMFDFDIIFNQNSVFELEGLADDSDKAFALGLLIIYINEYRQVDKEINNKKGLKHLLVIEEAHRLLKNVSTEKNEDIGNPKGKAVEHFTNMLAEMRSYGQGVIVAEQIPTKLSPDVIKNSSNKIVHRIIAKDDQEIIANTIGIYPEDAIYIGNSKTGYALCHKEGMVQPVIVKIDEVESNNISDKNLYEKNIDDKIFNINKSIIKNQLSEYISVWAVKTLVSIMYNPNAEDLNSAIDNKIDLSSISLIPSNKYKKQDYIKQCIYESIVSLLVSGVFSNHKLPTDEFVSLIDEIIHNPIILNDVVNKEDEQDECEQDITKKLYLLNEFENFYNGEPKNKSVEIVAQLYSKEYANNNNITNSINDYTLLKNNQFVEDVKNYLEYLENKEEKEVIK
ncbi:ATP-binding protein [uncultured Brachyspira sp.]|uniref:ATP-binding protein n=1 Tax=uncultured Brachyspira sp. TaxID=221953 RepID=UPI0025987E0A|nr:ATP-binding protein [uncultured Brachyspira sp.]